MKVKLLDIIQKEELAGKEYADRCYFNPVLDGNDNWIISLEEVSGNTKPEYDWINNLPEIDFVPKIPDINPFVEL